MRARRLFGLTLGVLVAHACAWLLATGGRPRFGPGRAGVRGPTAVSAAAGRGVPLTLVAATTMPPAAAPPPARAKAPPPSGRARGSARHPPAGDGGASTSGPAAPWPVYATRAPASIALHYALARTGAAASAATGGEATLEWTNTGTAFALRVATAVDDRPPRDWDSRGDFDAAGLAPRRLAERERGREKRAIEFDRDAGRVRLPGARGPLPFAPGAQDRWSWVAQLAAIAEAGAHRGQLAGPWHLQVAGLRGELERWTFRVLPPGDPPPELAPQGNELSRPGDRAPALLHVLRATDHPYDLRIEAWLSPALHHFPAGLRMSTPPGPWSLSLWQRP